MIGDVWLPWIIKNDPGPTMCNFQTDLVAKDYAEDRAMPQLRSCDIIKDLMPADRHKDRTQEIKFPHMPLYIQGPSIANLQTKGIRFQWNSELWCWPKGRIGEALGRTLDYAEVGLSHVYNESQGGVDGDDWETLWSQGTKETWSVHCLQCGVLFPLIWQAKQANGERAGIVWEDSAETKDGNGKWKINAVIKTVKYICPHCGYAHTNTAETRYDWNRRGKYVAANPFASHHRSFRYNALACRDWSNILAGFLNATESKEKGDVGPLREWIQKQMAECWVEDMQLVESRPEEETFSVNSLEPCIDGEAFRFMTIDCQADLADFWFVVRAWNRDGESRLLHQGRASSWDELREIQTKLGVKDQYVFVDGGYEFRTVCNMATRFGHVGTIRGRRLYLCWNILIGRDTFDFVHAVKDSAGKELRERRMYSPVAYGDPYLGADSARRGLRAPFYRWSNEQAKDILRRLRDGKGAKWTAKKPETDSEKKAHDEYIRQINSEVKRIAYDPKTGRERWRWVTRRHGIANHLWDCECMQVIAAAICGILGKKFQHENTDEPEPGPDQEQVKTEVSCEDTR